MENKMTDLTPQMARAVIRGGGFAIGPEGIDYPQDVMAYIDAWEADRIKNASYEQEIRQLLDTLQVDRERLGVAHGILVEERNFWRTFIMEEGNQAHTEMWNAMGKALAALRKDQPDE